MQIPTGNKIDAITCECVNILAPEIKTPHFSNIILGSITGIAVTGCAHIQRNIKLCAAHGHIGILFLRLDSVHSTGLNDLRQFQPPIHQAGGILAQYIDRCAGGCNNKAFCS